MTRKPLLHAFFHSIASLGYIPFALTSVLLSSSTPFVSNSIPPIVIILIAFIPPLLTFPLLCFSYRYLERFECISLTVQRARTYVMLAGSGLCMLVAAHLVMVYATANESNSSYNRMVHEGVAPSRAMVPVSAKAQLTPPAALVLDSPTVETSRVAQQQQKQESGQDQALTETNNAQVPPPTAAVASLEDLDFSSFFMSFPTSELEPELSSYLGESAVDGSEIFVAVSQREQSDNKKANVVLPMANGGVAVKSLVPMHLYPDAPKSAFKVSPPGPKDQQPQGQELEQDKRDSVVAGQTSLNVGGGEEEQDKDALINSETAPSALPPLQFAMPSLDPISNTLMGAGALGHQNQNNRQQQQGPEAPLLPWSSPPPNFPSSIAASASEASTNPTSTVPFSTIVAHRDPNRTLGYNLMGIHWIIYLFAQGILIFLLVTLFLGVLILTEFVLDREDDDLVQIQYLYWSRVVGIASATIVSAVHGSLLSGYVLLEEHTDWIAKAAVGAIVVYWVGMTWIMNRMTGPLPY
ncbi:hypothetical protein BGZ91_002985 [Linnemannia elongata]|nr:hypothetical protein BGZ91_002985 [Linnemannia elongata]